MKNHCEFDHCRGCIGSRKPGRPSAGHVLEVENHRSTQMIDSSTTLNEVPKEGEDTIHQKQSPTLMIQNVKKSCKSCQDCSQGKKNFRPE